MHTVDNTKDHEGVGVLVNVQPVYHECTASVLPMYCLVIGWGDANGTCQCTANVPCQCTMPMVHASSHIGIPCWLQAILAHHMNLTSGSGCSGTGRTSCYLNTGCLAGVAPGSQGCHTLPPSRSSTGHLGPLGPLACFRQHVLLAAAGHQLAD
jgi:hypothetical protein